MKGHSQTGFSEPDRVTGKAADQIRSMISAKASDRDLSAALLRALRDGPDPETLRLAGALADRTLAREALDAESSRLLDILLKMMSRSDQQGAALLVSQRVSELPGAAVPLRRGAARVLLDAGSPDLTIRLLREPETAEDFLLLARAHGALGEHPLAVLAAEAAVIARPGDPYATAFLCDAALAAGRPELIPSAVAALPDGARTAGLLLREAQAMESFGDVVGAVRALSGLLEKDPMNAPVRRRLISLLQGSGRGTEATSCYREGVILTASRLPDDPAVMFTEPLALGLTGPIPRGRLDWVRQAVSAEVTSREAEEFLALDLGLLSWIQARPERIGELVSRVRLSGSTQDLVMALRLTGSGALIAAAHVGLMYGGPLAMMSAGLRFGFVASMPPVDLPRVSEHLISVSGRERSAIAREVIGRVQAGEAVAIAIDGAGAPGSRICEIFGHPVPISDICVRLSARLRVPAFFPWILPGSNGTISVDLSPLPTLMTGEEEGAFTDRWLRAWTSEVEAFLTAHPTGMRGSGGLWNAISAT